MCHYIVIDKQKKRVNTMNVQAYFNEQVIEQLDIGRKVIKNANSFDANQMRNYTLRSVLNTTTVLTEMSTDEKIEFENDLLRVFKLKNWV